MEILLLSCLSAGINGLVSLNLNDFVTLFMPFYRWHNWITFTIHSRTVKTSLGWWSCLTHNVPLTSTVLVTLCLPQSTQYTLCSLDFVQTSRSVGVIMALLTYHLLSKSHVNPTLQHQHPPKAQRTSSTAKVISPSTLPTVWNPGTAPKVEHRACIQTPGDLSWQRNLSLCQKQSSHVKNNILDWGYNLVVSVHKTLDSIYS